MPPHPDDRPAVAGRRRLAASDLYERAVTASGAGRFAEARGLLGRAARRTDDPDLQARVKVTTAYVEAETGQVAAALELCQEVIDAGDLAPSTRALAVSQRGLLRARSGDLPGALADLGDAIGGLEDTLRRARALNNRGNLHLATGDLEAAERDFTAARADFERAAAEPGRDAAAIELDREKAGFNLGYVRLLAGDLVQALALMDELAPRLATLGPLYRATIQQDRAEVLIAAGLVEEGEQSLADAAHAFGSRGLRGFQAEAELIRARTLVHVRPAQARRVARQAGRRFRARESQAWADRADAVAVVAEVEAGGRSAPLLERARDLASRLEGIPVDGVRMRLTVARLLVRRGELDEAGSVLAGVGLGASTPLDLRLLAHEVRADLARARGDRPASYAHVRAGLAELHAWQASFGSLDLQSTLVGHGRQLAVDGLRMAVEDGEPELLFEWSERARALVSRVIPLRAPAEPQLASELTELRWLTSQRPDADSDEGRRLAELQAAVRQHAWYGEAGTGEVAEPLTLAELQAELDADTALVAHVVSRGRVVALVVTDRDATVHDLPGQDVVEPLLGGLMPDLDMAAAELPDRMAAVVRGRLAARLDDLAACLVTPLLGAIGPREVALTPSGLFAGVPWSLLPGLVGRPLVVAQSATGWRLRRREPLRFATAGFVAGPRVPRAVAEVTAAAAAWPSATVLAGDDATADAVTDLASHVDVLHVSAHGRHAVENPLFSGLELADGPWFGYDIDLVDPVPDVVLLSACEVGRSTLRGGEELIGMATAWLHAGARCVIAAPAAVNDEVAHDVLVALHAAMAAGEHPAVALARAVAAVTADRAPAAFCAFV